MSRIAERIEKYFNSTSQYPLWVVVSVDEYHDILAKFPDIEIPRICVSEYCIDDDKEPDIDKLLQDVKNIKGNYLLIGLGNYLANKGEEAKSCLLPYKDLILQPNSKVALILSAHMYPVAKDIVSSDLRIKQRVILPQSAPVVPIVGSTAMVYGIKAYLKTCERGETVGSVKSERKIINANVINPDIAYDELKHLYPNEFNKLLESLGSKENWSRLLEAINKSRKNILQYLATKNFASPEHIFIKYAKNQNYDSWLYLLWIRLQADNQSYLGVVATKTNSHGELFDVAKNLILDVHVSDKRFIKYYQERKLLLKGCKSYDMADYISKIIVRGTDRIAYLTDNTKIEKQAILTSLCEGANSEYLEMSYRDLYSYLQNYKFADKIFTEYFSEYKKCKTYNKVSDEFASTVSEYAVNRPYNSLPTRSAVFSGLDDGKTFLFFLDALGVEFLGYISLTNPALQLTSLHL